MDVDSSRDAGLCLLMPAFAVCNWQGDEGAATGFPPTNMGPPNNIEFVRLSRRYAVRGYVNTTSANVGQVANLPELRQVSNLPHMP